MSYGQCIECGNELEEHFGIGGLSIRCGHGAHIAELERSLAASRVEATQEKTSRIEYQSVVYEVCNLLDKAFSLDLLKGQGTTVDEVVPGVTKLRAERDASREEVELVQTGRENIHAYCDYMEEQHGREVTRLKVERDASRALVAEKDKALAKAADSVHGMRVEHDAWVFQDCPEYPCPDNRRILALPLRS